jgi:hypothetical protein
VTDPAAVRDALAATEDAFGEIDVPVNNVGIGYFAAVEESADAGIRRMFEINVFGLSDGARAALPAMRRRGSGTIVNYSSIGGLRSFPAVDYYTVTARGVRIPAGCVPGTSGPPRLARLPRSESHPNTVALNRRRTRSDRSRPLWPGLTRIPFQTVFLIRRRNSGGTANEARALLPLCATLITGMCRDPGTSHGRPTQPSSVPVDRGGPYGGPVIRLG